MMFFFFYRSAYHRDLHVLTHSFPTRRSSDLHSGQFALVALLAGQFPQRQLIHHAVQFARRLDLPILLASRRAVGRSAALTTSGEDLREEGREEEAVGVSRLLHARARSCEIGRAQVRTPVTNAALVCRLP